MSRNEAQKNWIVILTLLLLIAMVAAGPFLTAQIGPGTQQINLTLPVAINGSNTIALSSLVAIGVLIVLIVGTVAVVGWILTVLFLRLDRETTRVKWDDQFQTNVAALAKSESEKVNLMRQFRGKADVPNHQRPVWSIISSSLAVLLFVTFLGMLINSTFIPDGEYVVNGRTASAISATLILFAFIAIFVIGLRYRHLKAAGSDAPLPWDTAWVIGTGLLVVGVGAVLILLFSGSPDVETTVNSAVPVIAGMILIALLILAWRIQPQKFTAMAKTDDSPIPWDFLWVLVSGLLVVGLGIGLVIYFNTPVR